MLVIVLGGRASAATQHVTATISFDTPLAVTNVTNIDFGTVKAEQAGTHQISPSGNVTVANGGVWLYGTPEAGLLMISGSSTQTISISTGSYVAQGGVTPSRAICKYGSAVAAACDAGLSVAAPGTSTPLLLGVQVVTDGSSKAGSTAAPSFTVTAVYN